MTEALLPAGRRETQTVRICYQSFQPPGMDLETPANIGLPRGVDRERSNGIALFDSVAGCS